MKAKLILPIIVFSQFAGTSLWFAGNAIMPELTATFGLDSDALYDLTSSVQLGFILGTLTFAILTIADRYSPSKVFFAAALSGALLNILPIVGDQSFTSLFISRFGTGFCLAGIYPVGMKIASDYHEEGLGKALGYLVGALVLGNAFPFFVQNLLSDLSWKLILISTSLVAVVGGFLILQGVPDGPYRKPSLKLEMSAAYRIFHNRSFRGAAFGYFGHMWELYTFWTFIPVILAYYAAQNNIHLNSSILSSLIMGFGAISCVLGGYLSIEIGSKKTALAALTISGICCLLSPIFLTLSFIPFLLFLFVWGIFVIADSPQFSTLVARYAPPESKGTALTLVNSLGFAITIISIQFVGLMTRYLEFRYVFMILAVGPLLGLIYGNTLPKEE